MHCLNCDALLSDYEATRRDARSGEYLDICQTCFNDLKSLIPTRDRKDLLRQSDIDDDFDDVHGGLYNNYIDNYEDER